MYVRQEVRNAFPLERSPLKSAGVEGFIATLLELASEVGMGDASAGSRLSGRRAGGCVSINGDASPNFSNKLLRSCWVAFPRMFESSIARSRAKRWSAGTGLSSDISEGDMGKEWNFTSTEERGLWERGRAEGGESSRSPKRPMMRT